MNPYVLAYFGIGFGLAVLSIIALTDRGARVKRTLPQIFIASISMMLMWPGFVAVVAWLAYSSHANRAARWAAASNGLSRRQRRYLQKLHNRKGKV